MSYNPNIPVVTDPILLSAFQIKANFQALAQAFASNHSRLNGDPALAGKHTVLTMRPQLADPVTTANQVALYNKIVSSVPQLFYRPNNSQTPIQLTYDSILADSSDAQYTFIAGPFIVYAGFIKNITVGQLVSLTPGSVLIYVDLTVTAKGLGANLFPTLPVAIPTNISGMSFNIQAEAFASGSMSVYYFAIGLP